MNRRTFFDVVRPGLFRGNLDQDQVDGFNAILDEWERRKLTDLRWLAYMLATAYHETAHTMQPIREYGRGKGRKYGAKDTATGQIYYGRGFVQLTWKDNYRKAGEVLGVDLINEPDRAMELPIATAILFDGMIHGWFTGKSLRDFFPSDGNGEWRAARKIINGTDRAELISGYALTFLAALDAAEEAAEKPAEAAPPVPASDAAPPPKASQRPAEGREGAFEEVVGGKPAAIVGILLALFVVAVLAAIVLTGGK